MSEKREMKDIIVRIKDRRNELMMSYQDLADKTGLSKSTLQRYETGSIKNMPIDKFEILAKALNVNPVWLMGYDAPKEMPHYVKTVSLTQQENMLIENFNKLNDLGKDEANKRVAELTEIPRYKKEIWEEEGKEDLMPKAAHMREGATKEDIQHDNDIMNNDDLWND